LSDYIQIVPESDFEVAVTITITWYLVCLKHPFILNHWCSMDSN
jgi:hypothetical protein